MEGSQGKRKPAAVVSKKAPLEVPCQATIAGDKPLAGMRLEGGRRSLPFADGACLVAPESSTAPGPEQH